jgi:hypothetical protein
MPVRLCPWSFAIRGTNRALLTHLHACRLGGNSSCTSGDRARRSFAETQIQPLQPAPEALKMICRCQLSLNHDRKLSFQKSGPESHGRCIALESIPLHWCGNAELSPLVDRSQPVFSLRILSDSNDRARDSSAIVSRSFRVLSMHSHE